MSMPWPLFIGNDTYVTVPVIDIYNSPVDGATVTMTLFDIAGNAISGAQNLALDYITGSAGQYQGIIPGSVGLSEGAEYSLAVTAVSGDYTVTSETDCVGAVRGGEPSSLPVKLLFISTDNVIAAKRWAQDGTPINDATVTMSLSDGYSNPVSGAQDLPLDYVADSSGEYQGIIPASVTAGLVEGAQYLLTITSTGDGNGLIVLDCVACE